MAFFAPDTRSDAFGNSEFATLAASKPTYRSASGRAEAPMRQTGDNEPDPMTSVQVDEMDGEVDDSPRLSSNARR